MLLGVQTMVTGKNWGLNTGFETEDASWSSGVRHWNATTPTLSSGDSFAELSNQCQEWRSASLEASISASCSDESSNGTQGISQNILIMKA